MDVEQALAEGAALLHEGTESNSFAHIEYEQGDVDQAFAEADHVFRKRLHHGRFHAAPLEGRATLADWDAGTRELTVWMSTQIPHLVRTLLCHSIGLTEKQLRVIAPDVGGAFGLKLHLWPEDYLVSVASMRAGSPVKWVEDRYEALAASLHAKEIVCDLEIATRSDGTFLAMRAATSETPAPTRRIRSRRSSTRCAPPSCCPTSTTSAPLGSRSTRSSRTSARPGPTGGRLDERPDGP